MFLFLFLKEIPAKEQSFPAGNKSYTKSIISFKNMPSTGWVDISFFSAKTSNVCPFSNSLCQPLSTKAGTPYYVAPQVTGVISHGDVMILLYEKCGEDDLFFHISINIKVK